MKGGIVPSPDQFETGVPRSGKNKAAKPGTRAVSGVLSGALGAKYDGKIGATEGFAADMLPLVELDGVRSITVQLRQEGGPPRDQATMVQPPDLEGTPLAFIFDSANTGPVDDAPASGQLYLNGAGTTVYGSSDQNGGGTFDSSNLSTQDRVRIEWPGGSATYAISNVTDGVGFTSFDITLPAVAKTGTAAPNDGDAITVMPLEVLAPVLTYPNASARARVRVRSSQTGEYTFECDWCGGFQINAQSLEIERVSWRPNLNEIYHDQTVKLSAAVALDGVPQRFGPQYTIPPIVVGAIEPRVILIPEFARRVSLLVKYGSAPGGDAPLAALFLGFALPLQGSQGFIDALSARGSLFGEGLPIPHGAYALVLTNLSGVADLEMGVIFHLGL